MKVLKSLFLLSIILAGIYSCNHAQESPSDKTLLRLKEFYRNYVSYCFDTNVKEGVRKTDSIQKEYCTDAFYKKIPDLESPDQMDCDIFLNTQFLDSTALNTLVIKKDSTKLNQYIVSYYYPNNSKVVDTIHLFIVNDKIDSVWSPVH
jgi:hypothetical protein